MRWRTNDPLGSTMRCRFAVIPLFRPPPGQPTRWLTPSAAPTACGTPWSAGRWPPCRRGPPRPPGRSAARAGSGKRLAQVGQGAGQVGGPGVGVGPLAAADAVQEVLHGAGAAGVAVPDAQPLRALAVKVHLEVAAARGDHVPLVKVFALYDPSGQPAGFAWANRVDGALVTR